MFAWVFLLTNKTEVGQKKNQETHLSIYNVVIRLFVLIFLQM